MITYNIRAHHGMCLTFFQGKGYSGDFVENMGAMKKILEQNPLIRLVEGYDDALVLQKRLRSAIRLA